MQARVFTLSVPAPRQSSKILWYCKDQLKFQKLLLVAYPQQKQEEIRGTQEKQWKRRETSKAKCFPYKRPSGALHQTSSSVNSLLRSCQQEVPLSALLCLSKCSHSIKGALERLVLTQRKPGSRLPPPPNPESQNKGDYLLPLQHFHLFPLFLPWAPHFPLLFFMCFKGWFSKNFLLLPTLQRLVLLLRKHFLRKVLWPL